MTFHRIIRIPCLQVALFYISPDNIAGNEIKQDDEDLLERAHMALFRLDNPAVVVRFPSCVHINK